MRRTLGWTLGLALVVTATTPALADTLKVPQQFATIAEAVAAADGDDTIVVSKGTYAGGIVLQDLGSITIKGKKGAVIDADGEENALSVVDCVDVRIQGLTFQGATDATLRILGSRSVQVTRCDIDGGGGDGILIDDGSSDVEIGKVNISDVGNTGVNAAGRDDASEVTVTRSRFVRCGGTSVSLSSPDSLITRCVSEESGQTGFATDGENSPIERCTVLSAGLHGIQTFEPGSPVSRCKVANTDRSGIQTFDDDSGVDKCRATDVDENGIQTFGDNSPIDRCKLERTGSRGVQTFGADSPISKTLSRDVGRLDESVSSVKSGIQTFGERSNITSCKAFTPVSDGIAVHGNDSHISGCKVTGPGRHGMSVAEATTIARSTIKDAVEHGVIVYGGSDGAFLDRLKIIGSGMDGLHVETTGLTVAKTKVKSSSGLDLNDENGGAGNDYSDKKNKFGTTNLP